MRTYKLFLLLVTTATVVITGGGIPAVAMPPPLADDLPPLPTGDAPPSPASTQVSPAAGAAPSTPPAQKQPKKSTAAEAAQDKWDNQVGAALVLYRDGKVTEAEKALRTVLKTTTEACLRQLVLGYLAEIKVASGNKDKSAESLFAQATANKKCRFHGDTLEAYVSLLKAKGMKAQAEQIQKLRDKQESIGSCEMDKDGNLSASLVSLPPGPIAHTFAQYKTTDKEYLQMLSHVGPLKRNKGRIILPFGE